ncbi:MAG: 2-oxo-4-hydroxy-4-carboxy-5-ureidoimidazoline decarboxylase [Mycobacterium sp.]
MHQGIGLDAFNELPMRKAVHALYECCNSVTLASELARSRPYADHDALFRKADAVLFASSEEILDGILQAYPHVGRRPRSTKSQAEQCAVWAECPDLMGQLGAAVSEYAEMFGFTFVMYTAGADASAVLQAVRDRMHHDVETERKVVRNEVAKINRTRMERMLGPEGGYENW